LAFVLRVYSFVFHLTLSTFLLGVTLLDYRSHQTINLDILPFTNDNLLRDTLLLSLAGIGCTLLALSARFKFVFVVWTIVAWYLMLKWFFLTGYIFDDARQSRGAVWLSFGALGAFFGAAWAMKSRRGLAVL
jgi:hypothetical protein